ncbi:MAG: NUDIX domain-containing protein [Gammaproteobacteria bacterium]|nr:NUDIX domain-containing protein [Gammaproteobacteria bacterium]NNJ97412.1 NUDIX domain-containing protein [Gammaproteobacteria bacterium]
MRARRPQIGVGVMVWQGDRLLLGKRISQHSENTWQFPGGHLEFGETVEKCAQREVGEEAGITIRNIVHCGYTNDVFIDAGKHYVTLFVCSDYDSGELRVMEPDKCEKWQWFQWNQLPEPLFLPIRNFLTQSPDLYTLHHGQDIQAVVHK